MVKKPKNILIGVCGFGNGHVNREYSIIKLLLKFNVNIVLAVPCNTITFFNKHFPDLPKIIVTIPWIVCDPLGMNFIKTLEAYKQANVDIFYEFLRFSIDVEKNFNGKPIDFVFTDYESNVAQYAYAKNKPLVCIEQQSKYLLFDDTIDNFNANEEKSRLLYFFPRAEMRVVSSFFQIKAPIGYNIEIIPPILKKMTKKETNNKKVLVYFSSFDPVNVNFEKILNLLSGVPHINFHVYCDLEYFNYSKCSNIFFSKINDGFISNMEDCSFIISSSGHQLISEAINLEIPLYIFPLNTFEQNYNCKMVCDNNLGMKISEYTISELGLFMKNLDFYKSKIKEFKLKYWNASWEEEFEQKVLNRLNIERKTT